MRTYILIDTLNLAHRAKNVTGGDIDLKIGMSLNIMLGGIRKIWNKFSADHAVFCFEGSSWRKKIYAPYKKNRETLRLKKSIREREDDELFMEAVEDLHTFLSNQTNSTVLQNRILEADDLISFWIDEHPDDKHIIVSTDSDFVQLLANDNVSIFNGITNNIIHKTGITDEKGNNLEFSVKSDGKLKVGKPNPSFAPDSNWYEFATFVKIVRGDTSDNIFSSFPGVRLKGTKNKIGITEAFEDRDGKGFYWNNFMLQRWVDENKEEHVVKDRFDENKNLIDLTLQPDDIRASGIETISNAKEAEKVSGVGIHFLRFCGKWDLNRLSNFPDEYATILNSGYKK